MQNQTSTIDAGLRTVPARVVETADGIEVCCSCHGEPRTSALPSRRLIVTPERCMAMIVVATAIFAFATAYTDAQRFRPTWQPGIVLRDSVDVRQGPGRLFNVVDVVGRGETVTVTGIYRNGWCCIRQKRQPNGWVYSGWISGVHAFGRRAAAFVQPVDGFQVGEPYLVERRRGQATAIVTLPGGTREEVSADALVDAD